MNKIASIVTNVHQLMFIDEAAQNRRTLGRFYGWSIRGMKCVQRRFFVRGDRFSILPILTIEGMYHSRKLAIHSILSHLGILGIPAHDIIHGSVTAAKFTRFLKDHVVPITTPYPGPRSILILDNCGIHHSEEVRALIEDQAGCKLVFLPPYSPDFNPIEEAFSAIKAYLRRHNTDLSLSIMDAACHSITAEAAAGFFFDCGYIF
jgi:transposase